MAFLVFNIFLNAMSPSAWICLAEAYSYASASSEMMLLVGRGILSVEAEGQDSHFLFATMHLESPIGPKSPLKTFFEEQRRTQAEQVWLMISCAQQLTGANWPPIHSQPAWCSTKWKLYLSAHGELRLEKDIPSICTLCSMRRLLSSLDTCCGSADRSHANAPAEHWLWTCRLGLY